MSNINSKTKSASTINCTLTCNATRNIMLDIKDVDYV